MTLTSPTGRPIIGTLERLYGVAIIDSIRLDDDGRIDFDYMGDTKIDWNQQRTVTRGPLKARVFVDDSGQEWLEHELTITEADDA